MTTPDAVLADAGLPGLSRLLASVPPDAVTVLAHKAGRRTTVAVREGNRTRIVKLFSPTEFGPALAVTRVSVRHDGLAPALLAVDEEHCLLELEHIAGHDLAVAHPVRLGTALRALGPVLARVHSVPPDGLAPWDGMLAVGKLRRFLAAAADVDTDPLPRGLVRDVARAADALADRAVRPPAHPVGVHGDTALRNVMVVAGGGLRLVDWDRSALGTPEVDLAPVVGVLGAAADGFLAGYRDAGGRVDDEVLADLVDTNRVTRALRRFATGREDAATVSERVGRVVEQVLQRPA